MKKSPDVSTSIRYYYDMLGVRADGDGADQTLNSLKDLYAIDRDKQIEGRSHRTGKKMEDFAEQFRIITVNGNSYSILCP